MPTREKRSNPKTKGIDRRNFGAASQPMEKRGRNRILPAGNSTRINAFVSAQGRRNQAKRDAR
jgi:hypothetical protein